MLPIRSTSFRWAAALMLLPALAACGDDPLGPQYPEDTTFAASLEIDLDQMTRLESGVYIQTLQAGEGDPVAAGTITVGYTLWIPDGTELQNGSFAFPIGEGAVIPGFELGVLGMRVGEIRKLVIPSALGYGNNPPSGSGIPKQSVLIFSVQLISVAEAA
ncbi:MAG TPA: FKBP-type peptidyl-prolyl cis-trans isomerase [Longimicrobiales bacterium]|nr:FKBP-type peptidyl-prolyl cis-trans isomerase [Longimicrobiales bacterium]